MNAQDAVTRIRKRGYTDEQIATEVGCTAASVYQWGRGMRNQQLSERMYKLFRLAERAARKP